MDENKFRVLVTGANLVSTAVAKLESIGATVELMSGKITEERLLKEVAQSPTHAILMRGNPPVTSAVLEAAPALRVIAKHGVGVDSVDLAAATKRGVLVMVAGDANAPAVAEMTMGFALALSREIRRFDAVARSGKWDRERDHGSELRGRTLGLIGFGRIGRRVAELARCFGVRVIAFSRSSMSIDDKLAHKAESLESLLAEADIVSLHCPLDSTTRGMMDHRAFGLMKPGALFINTARGALVDEVALAEALTSGHLRGAALDTLVDKPPAPDNPLLSAPNLILTPHNAGITYGAVERMGENAAENIAVVLSGGTVDPLNVVNRSLLENRSK
jgi:D-3-phosphoglycerate dehydrogenase